MPALMESNKDSPKQSKYLFFSNLLIHSGDSIFLFPLLLVLFFMTDSDLKYLYLAIIYAMALTGIVTWIIKNLVRKNRPKGDYGKLYRKFDPYAFPSGHAARSFAIGTTVAGFGYIFPSMLIFGWAAWISLLRVKLDLHHRADILAGILTGVLTGATILLSIPYL